MATLASLSRVLTGKGYAITKSSITDKQLAQLRKDLTMKPQDHFAKGTESFPIYYESAARIYVPRHWGYKTFGEPEANIVPEGLPFSDHIRFRTTFPPHDFQVDIIQSFLAKGANGLICVPCGYGKTFMALHIAVQIGKRFLIVVDKEFLMNQWKAEIENFIEGATVGILQAGVCQVGSETTSVEYSAADLKQMAKDAKLPVSGTKEVIKQRLQEAGIDITPKRTTKQYDITICMIQTICRQEYPEGFFSDYGLTIFDECHHLGAAYFCTALKTIQTKAMLGLSATPDRDDGMSCIFEYYLGEAVYKKTQRAPDKDAVVKAIWFHSDDPVYAEVPVNYRGETVTATLLNNVSGHEPRNQKILEHMQEYIEDPNRFILLISDRISQLEWFEAALQATHPMYKVGYYIGGMKQTVLDENAATCQLLLATYQMVAEGFSVKKLNTIVLTTPRKKVEQASGRIFRERIDERKVAPHIIDIIDSHDCHKRRWAVRQKFYKDSQYTIQHIDRPKPKKELAMDQSLFRFAK
jgi:superfamily II DNA or RNA helicase